MMPFRARALILPAAAMIITGLYVWRVTNPPGAVMLDGVPQEQRPAPVFQLYDQESRLVNLNAFLHRHTIVIVFFDGSKGPEANPTLVQLREFHDALKREQIIVMGVSTALPQENRNNSSRPFPFPLLTDAVATDAGSVHQVWGRFIEPPSLDRPAGTRPGVFVIDRAGRVAWDGNFPQPEQEPQMIVSRLLGG